MVRAALKRAWQAAGRFPAVRQAVVSAHIFLLCDQIGQYAEYRHALEEWRARGGQTVTDASEGGVGGADGIDTGTDTSAAAPAKAGPPPPPPPEYEPDRARTARMVAFGTVFSGFVAYRWYQLLERLVPWRWGAGGAAKALAGRGVPHSVVAGGWHHSHAHAHSSAAVVAQKTVVHSLLYAPLHLATFNAVMALAEGEGLEAARQRAVDRVPRMWMHGSLFWIPIAVGNFTFVLPQNRAMVNATANLAWVTYLSLHATAREPITRRLLAPGGPAAAEAGADH